MKKLFLSAITVTALVFSGCSNSGSDEKVQKEVIVKPLHTCESDAYKVTDSNPKGEYLEARLYGESDDSAIESIDIVYVTNRKLDSDEKKSYLDDFENMMKAGYGVSSDQISVDNTDNGTEFIAHTDSSKTDNPDTVLGVLNKFKSDKSGLFTTCDGDQLETNISESKTTNGEISPEFKAAMDAYLEFMTKYADFMKRYQESEDQASMIGEMTQYLADYSDYMNKLSEWDAEKDNMSDAELLYYMEIQAKVSKVLAEAGQ